ncbi:ABC transporter permease [Actinomadura kijaniata]|uniref:Simple sugar transport system permease protein n=1 Tax=Actinomadura namibiensis TaxID=182080 RepID=A0A7W3QPF6_ACTNM|nr:ABC transporter permease [Actinomadura namibiensis]MBA8954551.1 simple sugar transport system permease protein [Actinomadura namibiensis]
MNRLKTSPLALTLLAALTALVFSIVITSIVLSISGFNPPSTFQAMVDYGTQPDSLVNIINKGTMYFLAAIAVAVGFRMNLFNIGVDGQYRMAAMLAAALGGAFALPPGLHQIVILLAAMAVGAAWAGIVGVLKVTRGVSEVISSIMLNFIATGIIAYLIQTDRLGYQPEGSDSIGTHPIAESGWIPGIPFPGAREGAEVYGLIVLAVIVGIAFHVVINRTRFGFDLRATGLSASAAVASGVNAKRMVVTTMLISGATAGLIGMPELLGTAHSYSLQFPTGLGFLGIGIALLGRNNPIGITFAALLWAFLDESSQILDFNDIPKEIVAITQAAVLLSVVVVYEIVHRLGLRWQQQAVAAELAAGATKKAEVAS